MNKTDAITEAKALVGSSVAPLISDADWERSAARSLMWDDQGRVPGAGSYVDTYDAAWLAADALFFQAARLDAEDNTKRLTVDGDTIEVEPGNLRSLGTAIRSRSPIQSLVQGSGPFQEYRVESGLATYFRPTSGN